MGSFFPGRRASVLYQGRLRFTSKPCAEFLWTEKSQNHQLCSSRVMRCCITTSGRVGTPSFGRHGGGEKKASIAFAPHPLFKRREISALPFSLSFFTRTIHHSDMTSFLASKDNSKPTGQQHFIEQADPGLVGIRDDLIIADGEKEVRAALLLHLFLC